MTSNDEVVDMETGEVLSGMQAINAGALAQLNASEIDMQIATAKRYPRQLATVRREIMGLVIADEETAASMIYALPRSGKVISGPTARFAEIVAYGWGNNRYGARIIEEGDTHLRAQGVFFDLEKNVAVSIEVSRRIIDKDGKRYNADMIGMTANAALSVASRNAILKAVPKALWKGLYSAAQQTVKGDIKTLGERRNNLIEQCKAFDMTSGMVCRLLGVGGVSEITIEHLSTLQGMLTALKDGETTAEQLMSDAAGGDAEVAAKGKATVENIKRQYQRKPHETSAEVKQQAEAAQAKLVAAKKRETSAPKPAENPDAEPVEEKQPGLPMDEGSW